MNIILLKNKKLDTKSIKITECHRILLSRYYTWWDNKNSDALWVPKAHGNY